MPKDGWRSLNVKEDAWKRARELKHEDETWSEYIVRTGEAERPVELSESELRELLRDEIERATGESETADA